MMENNIFRITCVGDKTVSELVKYGKYDWANNLVTDKLFPLKKHALVSRMVELIELDYDSTPNNLLAELDKRVLERSTYEDALYFGIEHPEEQRKRPVVFLHEPIRISGDLWVIMLSGNVGWRDFRLISWQVGKLSRRYVFAAVHP